MDETVVTNMRATERRIYELLSQGMPISKRQLFELLPSYDVRDKDVPEVVTNWNQTLQFHLSNLRKKLQPHAVGIVCQRNGSEANTQYVLSRLLRRE